MTDRAWLHTTQGFADSWGAEEILDWALHRFGNRIAMASGFGPEGMVLIDIASRLRSDFQVFTLDTGLLFPETYALMQEVEERYAIQVEHLKPTLSVQQQEHEHGATLWLRDPDSCCAMRKIEPLRTKLASLNAWITAIRRDQTRARANAQKVEWDPKFGLIKINPLCDWTSDMVWNYIRENDVPFNALHDDGFPSIGCWPCTRAVRPGEDARAGRWSGFAKNECGLHQGVPLTNVLPVLQEQN